MHINPKKSKCFSLKHKNMYMINKHKMYKQRNTANFIIRSKTHIRPTLSVSSTRALICACKCFNFLLSQNICSTYHTYEVRNICMIADSKHIISIYELLPCVWSMWPRVSICSTRSLEFHWLIPKSMAVFPSSTSERHHTQTHTQWEQYMTRMRQSII